MRRFAALASVALAFGLSGCWTEHFDGAFTNPFWTADTGAPTVPQWVDGSPGQALRLNACGVSRPGVCNDGTSTGSSSDYGQLVAVYTTPSQSYASDGQDATYSFRLRFPSGYQPTPITQNTLFEVHVDQATERDAGGRTAYSTSIGVRADGNVCPGTPPYCTTPGTNPRLFLQTAGGVGYPDPVRFFPFEGRPLVLGHWYTIALHVHWSPTAGHVTWQVDGQTVVDAQTPTLYTRSDGSPSSGSGVGLYDYRWWSSWPAAVDFDELTAG